MAKSNKGLVKNKLLTKDGQETEIISNKPGMAVTSDRSRSVGKRTRSVKGIAFDEMSKINRKETNNVKEVKDDEPSSKSRKTDGKLQVAKKGEKKDYIQ